MPPFSATPRPHETPPRTISAHVFAPNHKWRTEPLHRPSIESRPLFRRQMIYDTPPPYPHPEPGKRRLAPDRPMDASVMENGPAAMRFQEDRRQKGAETFSSLPQKRAMNSASMGPRPIGRGNPTAAPWYAGGGIASMGPRPIGRGNYVRSHVRFVYDEASMGPRPIGRGNALILRFWCAARTSFNGAATNWSRKCDVRREPRAAAHGFNGAATNWSRKCPELCKVRP